MGESNEGETNEFEHENLMVESSPRTKGIRENRFHGNNPLSRVFSADNLLKRVSLNARKTV